MANQDDRNLIDSIFEPSDDSGDQAVDDNQTNDWAPEGEEPTDIDDQQQDDDQKQADTQDGQQQTDQEPSTQQAPEWQQMTAGRFKSPEDLARAYREIERFATQSQQQVSVLRRELEELRRQLQPDLTKKQQEDLQKQVQLAINKAVMEEDPSALMDLFTKLADHVAEQKLAQRYQDVAPLVQQRKFQQEINDFLAENPEAAQHIDDIAKLVQQDPELVSRPGWLYRAYTRVLNQKVALRQQQQAVVDQKVEAQKKAAAMPGSGSRPKQEKKDPEQEILDQIFGTPKKEGIFG